MVQASGHKILYTKLLTQRHVIDVVLDAFIGDDHEPCVYGLFGLLIVPKYQWYLDKPLGMGHWTIEPIQVGTFVWYRVSLLHSQLGEFTIVTMIKKICLVGLSIYPCLVLEPKNSECWSTLVSFLSRLKVFKWIFSLWFH